MRVFVFDLEADGFVGKATKAHCGVFKELGEDNVLKFRPHQIKEMLVFMNTCDVLIGHNIIGYDFPLLKKLYKYEYRGKKVDTLIMSRLLDPKRISPHTCPNKRAPHSVEAWGYRVGRGKPEHDDWENFSENMLHRCSEDTHIQELIYYELLKEAKGKSWKNAFLLSFKLFENLQKQEEYGWYVDKPYMEECIKTLDRWIERIDRVIIPRLPNILEIEETKNNGEYNFVRKPFLKSGEYSKSSVEFILRANLDPDILWIGGQFSRILCRRVNLDSRNELVDFLLSLGWEPAEWNLDKEGERTSPKLSKDDPFEGITDKVGQLVAKRQQCKHRRSSIEGLIKLIREDGAIASSVNNLAVTGRATHRGIVNIPKASSFFGKQMRKMFSTRPGMVLVGTDSDSCQLRMLGGRMGDPAYIEAIMTGDKTKGTDLHSLTKKIGGIESRDLAKNVIYCLLFGGGDDKLGKTAHQPGNGKQLREKLYKGFDGLEALVQGLTEEWKRTAKKRFNSKFNRMEYYDGCITGLDGRPIKVPYEHQLLVYLLQSDEAIMMSAAYNMANLWLSRKYKYGIDFGFLCWYHDEYNVECRPEIAEDVKDICEKAITWAGEFYKIKCPHVGDGKIGKNWADVH